MVKKAFAVDPETVLTSEEIRRRAFRTQQVQEKATALAERSSVVALLLDNLTAYLTEVVPSQRYSGMTLLQECIEEASTAAQATGLSTDRATAVNVLRAMLYRIPAVLEYSVRRDEGIGATYWDPYEETLAEWRRRETLYPVALARTRPADTSHIGVAPADFRMVVLSRFLTPGALTLSAFGSELGYLTMRAG